MSSGTRAGAGFGGVGLDPGGREWLAAIVESSTDAVIGKTLNGTITDWNAGAAEMYGYQAQEMIGRNISVLFPDDRKDELRPIMERLRRGARIDHYETKRVRKDGSLLDVSVSISPVLAPDGTVIGAASVARDISGRIQAEAERRAVALMGGLAHDFNNMLSVIIGYAEQIGEARGLDPATRSDAGNILLAAKRASQLTGELMNFSRQEGNRSRPLRLQTVLAEFRGLLTAAAGPLAEVEVAVPADLPPMRADRGRLEHALLNLAVNARDAMPGGGILTFAAGAVRLTEADGVQPGTYIRLSASDTGSGMTREVARRVIEPFYSTKPAGKGTGLGLSSVHGIVTSAGGTMTIDSQAGAGTTVTLYFPAAPAEPEPRPAATPAPQAGGATVLIVDDEPAVLALTSRMLRRNGYQTIEADNGADALRLLGSEHCQLLLTDQMMPGMSGAQLGRRAQEKRPGLAVLRMTGSTGESGNESRHDQPRLIRKPFTEPDLIAQVRAAIEQRAR
ncbi:MAG TPA: PAS domain S-box protein [Streptosporangiaceae bacterium]|nr:PAS domain S-box protein [Streptosporangiaceae bacterium]